MLTYDLEQRGREARYVYLYRCIKADIAEGRLKSGERLPSKRARAKHLALSVVTVENAYLQLLSEGYIEARERSGYFVCKTDYLPPTSEMKKIETKKEGGMPARDERKNFRYDFATNRVNGKYFPFSVWARLVRETLLEGGEELLRRSPFNGELRLRKAVADYLLQSRGIHADPENVVIGAGTESLYGLIVQLIGRERTFGLERLSYPKIAKVYRANGAKTVFFGSDEQGVKLDEVQKSAASVLHVSPAHHYPTGVVTAYTRRLELLHWANEKNGFIVEDDYDSEFRLIGKPIQPLQALDARGRVIYVNTFSKTLAPSIRIAYMVLPPDLMAEFKKKLGFYACAVPNFEQITLSKFIERGHFERHLNRMRNVYRAKRDEAIRFFEESGVPLEISEENAGLHFLVTLKTERSDEEVRAQAAKQGVKLSFLSDFLADGSAADESVKHKIVVNYSGL